MSQSSANVLDCVERPRHSDGVTYGAILEDLEARELVQDSTDRAALAARLAEGPIVLYCGFDPTADSLHAGHLLGLLTLRRFQLHGHRPIALAGGATGMIGDPGGRSEERNLLTDIELAHNLESIVPQLRRLLDFDAGPAQARLHDNRSWTVALTAIDFLRDVGKHVTVNNMLGKESVRSRIESEHGISYTEFSYMLLQAHDFLQLNELEGCELQIGGSDQWGNITLGVDLVRRRAGRRVHGLTWPLLTRADGTKYGKTASGEQPWLAAHRLSPYRFFQLWMQLDDADVRKPLLQLTLLPVPDVETIMAEHNEHPELRGAQRRLALELTALVHGEQAARASAAASQVLFGGDAVAADEATLTTIAGEVPSTTMSRQRILDGMDPVDLLVEVGLAASRGDARRTLEQRGIAVNNAKLDPGGTVGEPQLLHGRFMLLRKGRSNYHLVIAE
jgi:tyrosyl-tRNA synthetase